MTSVTDLRELVEVVIGVDTHAHTHSAAVVDARIGGVLDQITVPTPVRVRSAATRLVRGRP